MTEPPTFTPAPVTSGTKRPRRYVYVDETGGDTYDRSEKEDCFFVVGVVVTEDAAEAARALADLQKKSRKQATKWMKNELASRLAFLEGLAQAQGIRLFGKVYRNRRREGFHALTVQAVVEALDVFSLNTHELVMQIDGTPPPVNISKLKQVLACKGFRVRRIEGVDDTLSPPIQLADSLAGAIREAYLEETDGTEEVKKALTKLRSYREILVIPDWWVLQK